MSELIIKKSLCQFTKTEEAVETDGPECGNKKLKVGLNRNGMQHKKGEYIDLEFNGNKISIEEASRQTCKSKLNMQM